MGDFTGFTFGNWRSSDWEQNLEVLRVSGGDRYDEELHPEIKDITAEVPGVNGEYYFGSNYGPKKIEIEIAFDSLTEAQFRELRRVFGTTKVKELIFDERPYKKYMAKLESPIELSYVCFDEPIKSVSTTPEPGLRVIRGEETIIDEETQEETVVPTWERESIYPYVIEEGTQRIYKGEGKIAFVCYFPFAKSVYKVLPEGSTDWAISSGILSAEEYQNFDKYDAETGIINVYNPGDIEIGFRFYIPTEALAEQIILQCENKSLVIDPITLKEGDDGVIVDTNTGIISGLVPSTMTIAKIDEGTGDIIYVEEVDESIHVDYSGNVFYTTSGNIYNQFVNSGYFFKIDPSDDREGSVFQVTGTSNDFQIFYDYLYF